MLQVDPDIAAILALLGILHDIMFKLDKHKSCYIAILHIFCQISRFTGKQTLLIPKATVKCLVIKLEFTVVL